MMPTMMAQLQILERPMDELLKCAAEGRPIASSIDNMDYYNALQTSDAYRYVICQKGDLELARRFTREHPKLKYGRRFEFSGGS
jgi:hypothetical protein